MPTIKKHNNRRAVRQRTAEGANHWVNSKDRNAPIRAVEKHSRASCFIRSRMTSQPHRLKKTSSMQSKRRDLHHTWLHCETNEKLTFLLLFTTMNNHNLFHQTALSNTIHMKFYATDSKFSTHSPMKCARSLKSTIGAVVFSQFNTFEKDSSQ